MTYDYDPDAPTNQYPADKVPDTMGYVPFAVLTDGETLCVPCVLNPTNPVHDATVLSIPCPNDTDGDGDCWMCARSTTPGRHPGTHGPDGWGVAGWSHSGEVEESVHCGHCNKAIVLGENDIEASVEEAVAAISEAKASGEIQD